MAASAFDSRVERLELKYLLDESRARRVRRQIRAYCSPDPHNQSCDSGGHQGYPLQSLYVDTPSLAFHRAKERGDAKRFKLRVRSYRGLDAACLEIKRRSSEVVQKTRVLIPREGLRETLRGTGKPWEETPASREALDRCARLVLETGAEPKLIVRYHREAYVSDVDSYARVTFDRGIAFQRTDQWSLQTDDRAWRKLNDHWIGRSPLVVLELKCETTIPAWLLDLVRVQELRRASVSKYSLGIYVTRRGLTGVRVRERARGVLH